MKFKGFTLIELVIVVIIIGILASIAIPSYQKFRDKQITNPQNLNKQHISNDVRSKDIVHIKQHSDGNTYACKEDDTACFVVK